MTATRRRTIRQPSAESVYEARYHASATYRRARRREAVRLWLWVYVGCFALSIPLALFA
jgi:hypothetical protein